MKWELHSDAIDELINLPEEHRELIKKNIEARKARKNPITSQRGVGISYDNHGEPIQYFKAENEDLSYRVFFTITDSKVILIGFRPRDNDTYLNLRDYTKRTKD